MRLITFFSVVLVVSASNMFQPKYAATLWDPYKKACPHCPAKTCSPAKNICRQNSRNNHVLYSGGRVPVPVFRDSEVVTWNFKARGLLN